MQARLRQRKNCGCTLEQALFVILLWSAYVRALR